jgi:hypothetical protein
MLRFKWYSEERFRFVGFLADSRGVMCFVEGLFLV